MMRNTIILPILITLLATLSGCGGGGNKASRIDNPPKPSITVTPVENIANWHLDYTTENENFLKEYIDSIEVIPLETTDECLIGTVTHIAMINDTIMVADAYKSQGIYLFGRDGSFICKVGSLGQGPMEYGSINQITVHGDTIEVLDWNRSQLLSYTLSDNNATSFNMSQIQPHAIASLNDTLYIGAYASSEFPRGHEQYALTWINRNDSVIATARPFQYARGIPAGEFTQASNGELLYHRNDCDTIFRITPTSIEPLYTLGLGGDIYDFVDKTIDLSSRDFSRKWFTDDESPLNHYDLCELENDWIINFQKGTKSYVSIVDKSTKTSKTYLHTDMKERHLYIPFVLYHGGNDFLLSAIEGVFIDQLNGKERQRLYEVYPYLEPIVENYDFEERNPLICILKTKH